MMNELRDEFKLNEAWTILVGNDELNVMSWQEKSCVRKSSLMMKTKE